VGDHFGRADGQSGLGEEFDSADGKTGLEGNFSSVAGQTGLGWDFRRANVQTGLGGDFGKADVQMGLGGDFKENVQESFRGKPVQMWQKRPSTLGNFGAEFGTLDGGPQCVRKDTSLSSIQGPFDPLWSLSRLAKSELHSSGEYAGHEKQSISLKFETSRNSLVTDDSLSHLWLHTTFHGRCYCRRSRNCFCWFIGVVIDFDKTD
jgi:hypothetical protein